LHQTISRRLIRRPRVGREGGAGSERPGPLVYNDTLMMNERKIVNKLLATVAIMAVLAYSGSLGAQTYFCFADKATGFRFDKATKTWVIAEFDVTDHKYILTQKGDKWTWTKSGEPSPFWSCSKKEEDGFSSVGAFYCKFGLYSELLMNRNVLRFQIMSPYIYAAPFDMEHEEGGDSPYIEIGKCAVVK
jgi:hypothetical protein